MNRSGKETRMKLLSRLERKKKETVKLCSDLIRIPSENPPGDTTEIAKFLREFLEKNGISVKEYEPKTGAPNLLAAIGQRDKRNIVFLSHMDVLPAGEGWHGNPYSGRVEGGKIHGRGTCDMKTGLAASLVSLLAASELERELSGKVTLCLVSDEETGGNWGTRWMLENVPEALGTACITGEPGGVDVIPIGEKGIFWVRLKASGRVAHGAYDVLGSNAILSMCRALPEVVKMREVHGEIPSDLSAIIEEEKPYVEEKYGKGVGGVLTRVSVSPGVIAGGVTANMIPDSCDTEVDMRLPIGVSSRKAMDRLQRNFREAKLSDVRAEARVTSEPNYSSPKHPFVEAVRKNVQETIGKTPLFLIKLGATDGRYYRMKGVPTVTYGPGMYNMSKPDEYVPVEELLTVTQVYGGVVADYLRR